MNMEQGKQFVTVEIPDGKEAKWNKQGLLQLVDKEQTEEVKPKDITERVKTLYDAQKELESRADKGDDKAKRMIEEYNAVDTSKASIDLVAYLQLRIITSALNEGWEPEFTEDERRWYPWFCFYTKEEIEKQDDEWKDDVSLQLWLRGGNSDNGSNCGLAFSNSYNAWSNSNAHVSARLVSKSQELSDYAAKQFATIWAEYFTGMPCLPWREYQEHEARAKEASKAGHDND